MILSDCYGDCSKGEFDLIVRGPADQVVHEVMHILLKLKPEDAIKVTEDYMKHLKNIIEELENENDTDINNDN